MAKEFVGFKPYFHQRAVIDELRDAKGSGKAVICKSSRQKGKSYMVAGLLLYFSINYARTNNYCVSPTIKQAKNIWKTIVDAISKSGIIKSKNATELTITLINGSTINFKSAEQRDALRGYTADFLCVDEAAYIPDDVFYGLILPWVDAKKAPMLIVSTPWTRTGFFHTYFQYGLEHKNNVVTIDWSTDTYKESIEAILPQEKLEEYRKFLPEKVFLTQYLGAWLDDDGCVFVGVRNCLYDAKIQKDDKLYVGIDWANQGEGDYSVLSVFNQNGEQVLLKYFNNLSPLRQIERLYSELEPYLYQIAVISSESNSIGTPYTELLKAKSQVLTSKIVEFNTSNQSKNAIVVNMQTAIEGHQVTFLPDERLIAEFGYFTADYNPKTRNVSYSAPNGLNDDIVMATLLAYDAYRTGTSIGSYNLSFKHHSITKADQNPNSIRSKITFIGK